MTGDSVIVSLLSGMTGAPHCIIMCGGIGSSIAMEAKKNALSPLLAYHLGRIVTYSLTGALMGAVGCLLT